MMKYTFWITEQTGKIDFAEKYLKPPLGGTYTWWRMLGLFFIALAVLWMFGYLSGQTAPSELIE